MAVSSQQKSMDTRNEPTHNMDPDSDRAVPVRRQVSPVSTPEQPEEVEDDSEDLPADAHQPVSPTGDPKWIAESSTTVRRKLGWWACTIIAVSTLLLFAALIFIIWLWNRDRQNKVWRAIVLHNWLTRSTTLSALVIRSAISFQGVLATSMIAALNLELRGVLWVNAAQFSISRSINSGPYLLLWTALSSTKDLGDWVQVTLLASLSASTVALQFTSSPLVSDIDPTTSIKASPIQDTILSSASEQAIESNISNYQWDQILSQRPNTFETFAEYVEAKPALPNGVDTSVTIRAFLPFPSQQNRTELREYTGTASLVDTRNLCTQPDLNFTSVTFTSAAFTFVGSVAPHP